MALSNMLISYVNYIYTNIPQLIIILLIKIVGEIEK